jgi:hypothetical protein
MDDDGSRPKPPWGGFGTFWNFVSQLHNDDGGLPQVLDRSVMGTHSGSTRSELYAALRFLGLIDDEKRPTDKLRVLAAEPTRERLREIIEETYSPVLGLELITATPTQVGDALVGMGTTPSTIARTRTFFLKAAEHGGIEIGIALKTRRTTWTSHRRGPRPKKKPIAEENLKPQEQPKLPPVIGALVAKLPREVWTEAEAKQWLGLMAPAIAYDYQLDLSKVV